MAAEFGDGPSRKSDGYSGRRYERISLWNGFGMILAVFLYMSMNSPTNALNGSREARIAKLGEKEKPRVNLRFLDGLRGLSALYVLLYHLYTPAGLPRSSVLLLSGLRFGHYAVAVFIVLSGYCLMLPVARGDGTLRGGTLAFIKRRARRILPPYYAALVLSLGFSALAMHNLIAMHTTVPEGEWRDSISPGSLISHLFLVHNFNRVWSVSIDSPMWSVATEWQIYFFFPLILLPVWRRFGSLAVILAGIIVGVAPLLLLPARHNLSWACPQFIGLFAIGMAAASQNKESGPDKERKELPWAVLSGAGFAAFFLIAFYLGVVKARPLGASGELPLSYPWIGDVLFGLATGALLIYCEQTTIRSGKGKPLPLLLRLLTSRAAMALGAFSYSLYLVHFPLVVYSGKLLHHFFESQMVVSTLQLIVAVPVIMLISYSFHIVFERPFMSLPAKARISIELGKEARN